jgi:hypothetical protein
VDSIDCFRRGTDLLQALTAEGGFNIYLLHTFFELALLEATLILLHWGRQQAASSLNLAVFVL